MKNIPKMLAILTTASILGCEQSPEDLEQAAKNRVIQACDAISVGMSTMDVLSAVREYNVGKTIFVRGVSTFAVKEYLAKFACEVEVEQEVVTAKQFVEYR